MALNINQQELIEIEREYCRRTPANFIKRAWSHIDPQPYVHGWHMDAFSDHLMACATGEIKRLLINVPPGTSKSMASSVFFPAWLWGPSGWPQVKFIGASYEKGLATRDNRKTRQLIESEWYQTLWSTNLTSDQNEKTFFENEKRGFRQSSAVNSMTGKRGNFVVWDDPLSPKKAGSDVERTEANRTFSEDLPSRLIDPIESVIIVIMQRLHHDDVSGYILAGDYGYEHLMLPMEYEPERKCYTSIGFEDPRIEEGELLFEKRFPREVVDRDKKVMGSYAYAGQMQQRPVPREGGLFKSSDFQYMKAVPAGTVFVRGWDLAATEGGTGAESAGVKIGRTTDGRYIVVDCTSGRYGPAAVRKLVKATAVEDDAGGEPCRVSLPKDPGQAGKDQAQQYVSMLAGHIVQATPESGDKVTRAEPFAAQVEAGNVYLIEGDWNKDYVEQLSQFPNGKLKDKVDASSRAFNEVVKKGRSLPSLEIGSVSTGSVGEMSIPSSALSGIQL